ncbi:MAG TPA: hypothetical protein VLT84_03270 [Acidobacteriota bacterium]|nr:hypothetical protein [Acidobacteriota bacterium]
MQKVTAGVLTGLVLGTVHGLVSDGGVSGGTVLFLSALARGSQGVINGLLAAYLVRAKTPLWRGGLVGAVIGAILGVVAGAQAQGSIPRASPLTTANPAAPSAPPRCLATAEPYPVQPRVPTTATARGCKAVRSPSTHNTAGASGRRASGSG